MTRVQTDAKDCGIFTDYGAPVHLPRKQATSYPAQSDCVRRPDGTCPLGEKLPQSGEIFIPDGYATTPDQLAQAGNGFNLKKCRRARQVQGKTM